MVHKKLLSVVSGAAMLALPAGAQAPLRGTSTDDWTGWGVLAEGKGYAPTAMGQVHFRDIGPREDRHPIVLLHQSPMSMIQFAEVQNALADMGVRSVTVDTPGYGMSDPPNKQPSIKDYADILVDVFDYLKLDKVLIAGHHTGAAIAASFASDYPNRVTAIIMHGVPQLTAEESSGHPSLHPKPRTPLADGSHLSHSFQGRTPPDSAQILEARTWMTLTSFISGPNLAHWAVFHYDMLPDLEAIKAPGLILSDANDSLHPIDLRVAEMRPDFEYVEFSQGSIFAFMTEPKRWAKIAAEYKSKIETPE
ncbi:MAG: alpha/beta hydrolase [Rhodospirillaceae bacterium]|nr:alpha/beta hydrolase [Rhodospirillaceae bacterium]